MVFAGLIGGLVGAQLDFLIQNWSEVSDDLLGNIFSGSGLVWFGGVDRRRDRRRALWARWRGMFGWVIADIARHPLAARLRGRPDRLPALGRRRLRHPVGRPLGDGLPRRHRAHDRGGPPDPGLRDDRDGHRRLVLWRLRDRFTHRHALRPLPGADRARSASSSSSSAATTTSPSASPQAQLISVAMVAVRRRLDRRPRASRRPVRRAAGMSANRGRLAFAAGAFFLLVIAVVAVALSGGSGDDDAARRPLPDRVERRPDRALGRRPRLRHAHLPRDPAHADRRRGRARPGRRRRGAEPAGPLRRDLRLAQGRRRARLRRSRPRRPAAGPASSSRTAPSSTASPSSSATPPRPRTSRSSPTAAWPRS